MGRKNYLLHPRQRSRLPANQELIKALRSDTAKPFGIRRSLTFDSSRPLVETMVELQSDGEIPDTINVRNQLHVTLMPLHKLGAQLTRGIVIGYEFGRRSAATKIDLESEGAIPLPAVVGSPIHIKNRHVGLKVESELLEREHDHVLVMMGRLGLRGAFKENPPLHISLGDLQQPLTRFERHRVTQMLTEVMPLGDEIMLEPLEFYGRSD